MKISVEVNANSLPLIGFDDQHWGIDEINISIKGLLPHYLWILEKTDWRQLLRSQLVNALRYEGCNEKSYDDMIERWFTEPQLGDE